MRIIAGRHRGRVLRAPQGLTTRPTADRVRESLFNILNSADPSLEGARLLDVFAGSGALGLEALSRGAASVVFFERDPSAAAILAENIHKLGEATAATLLRQDATAPPPAQGAPATLVLLDPPYKSGLAGVALPALLKQGWIDPSAVIVIEVSAAEPCDSPLPGWVIGDERRYGAARLVFLRPRREEDPPHSNAPAGGRYRRQPRRG